MDIIGLVLVHATESSDKCVRLTLSTTLSIEDNSVAKALLIPILAMENVAFVVDKKYFDMDQASWT